jgi:hypothetical protein
MPQNDNKLKTQNLKKKWNGKRNKKREELDKTVFISE